MLFVFAFPRFPRIFQHEAVLGLAGQGAALKTDQAHNAMLNNAHCTLLLPIVYWRMMFKHAICKKNPHPWEHLTCQTPDKSPP